jgi:hypothetical protein
MKAGYSEKGLMVTENGAAHESIMNAASGPEYARNYLQKSFIWAKSEGYLGIDWFTLSDGKDAADPFERMGLYEDISSLSTSSEAKASSNGKAYLTTSRLLSDARLNIQKTDALSLPSGAVGYVFSAGDQDIYALWAETGESESASKSVTLPLSGNVKLFSWDSGGESPSSMETATGSLVLPLTASPLLLTVSN